jgi:hypothetical protein
MPSYLYVMEEICTIIVTDARSFRSFSSILVNINHYKASFASKYNLDDELNKKRRQIYIL